MSMVGNQISGYLNTELFIERLFIESNEEKCPAFQSVVWFLIVHENTIKNCSTALQSFFFRSLSFIVSFVFFFMKARILLEFHNQSFSILYMFSSFSLGWLTNPQQENPAFYIKWYLISSISGGKSM